jgi:hypothetical protein
LTFLKLNRKRYKFAGRGFKSLSKNCMLLINWETFFLNFWPRFSLLSSPLIDERIFQQATVLGGVRNTTEKQYWSTIYKFCEGMLIHLQLWVSLAFISSHFDYVLHFYIEKECLVLMCA